MFTVTDRDRLYNSPFVGNGEIGTALGPTGYHGGPCPEEEKANRALFWAGRRFRDARGGSDYLIRDAVAIKRNYALRSQIIAGSVKTQNTLLSCLRAGVDIATVPEALFHQMFRHPLTDAGLAEFREDWRRVPP